jgi:hypothetical protein
MENEKNLEGNGYVPLESLPQHLSGHHSVELLLRLAFEPRGFPTEVLRVTTGRNCSVYALLLIEDEVASDAKFR